MALWRPDGQITCLGRLDDQIKLQGVRVELGEIVAALQNHPSVAAAVVRPVRAVEGDVTSLIGYVASSEQEPDPAELRGFLSQHLPKQMVPSAIVVIDRIPLTESGKVDAALLPKPGSGGARAPATSLERKIASVFEEVLGLEHADADCDFFEHGGQSLLAIAAAKQIEITCGFRTRARNLFAAPTPERLGRLLED